MTASDPRSEDSRPEALSSEGTGQKLGNLTSLKRELDADQITTKLHALKGDRFRGGNSFFKGHLAYLLKNRTYLGEIKHKGVTYPGEHEGIVPADLFQAVQEKLAEQASVHRSARAGSAALLVGRIYDDAGNRMTPSNTHKQGARYRYYVSFPLMQGRKDLAGSVSRVPAPDVEALVVDALRQRWENAWLNDGEIVSAYLKQVVAGKSKLAIETSSAEPADGPVELIEITWTPKGAPQRHVLGSETATALRSDMQKRLVTAIAKSRAWMQDLSQGRVADLAEIAEREGQSERYVRMLMPLAFLAPAVVEAAISGRIPERWGLSRLLAETAPSWRSQVEAIGFLNGDDLAA